MTGCNASEGVPILRSDAPKVRTSRLEGLVEHWPIQTTEHCEMMYRKSGLQEMKNEKLAGGLQPTLYRLRGHVDVCRPHNFKEN